jgi:uncharacterized Fe-S cluster-containing radical SAM superfamily enzyme
MPENIMAKLEFSDIRFEKDEKPEQVRLVFLKAFETHIDTADLDRLGEFSISEHEIEFPLLSEKELNNKFLPLLNRSFETLKSIRTGHKTIYIHQNSGIPLIGALYFGIVDRGTNMIEVKPITGCNINCPFCSVDEGISSRKATDFVVEDDYIISELKKLVEYKQEEQEKQEPVKLDIFINTHGEPLLYANMASLIRGLRDIPQVNIISIITNATLLTRQLADQLIDAGLNQLNISINAFDKEKARELAGTEGYNIDHILDICRYVSKKIKLIIAPVWIKGTNDDQIPKLIAFAKEIGADIGIQNYMVHKKGRKLAKQVEWEDFYNQLEAWEKQTGMDLKAKKHTLFKTRPLDKPFRKGDTVRAEIVSQGRLNNEMLAAAKGRVISIINCKKARGSIKVKILRDKDNVFIGEEIS